MKTSEEFGGVSRSVAYGDWCLSESTYQPALFMPKHEHSECYLSYVTTGSFEEIASGERHECTPGSVLWRSAGQSHSVTFRDKPTTIFRVEVAAELAKTLEVEHRNQRRAAFRDSRIDARVASIRSELRHSDPYTPLAVTALLYDVAAIVARAGNQSLMMPSWLRSVRDRLHDESGTNASLSELATFAGVHPSYLARSFRSHVGTSIGEYQRRASCEKACVLLRNRRIPIIEVALQLGFADQSHFTRTFKRVMGMTPRAYQISSRAS